MINQLKSNGINIKVPETNSFHIEFTNDITEDKIVTIKKRIEDLSNQLDKVMDLYQLGNISLDKITVFSKKT
jgi:hypothetical protein